MLQIKHKSLSLHIISWHLADLVYLIISQVTFLPATFHHQAVF